MPQFRLCRKIQDSSSLMNLISGMYDPILIQVDFEEWNSLLQSNSRRIRASRSMHAPKNFRRKLYQAHKLEIRVHVLMRAITILELAANFLYQLHCPRYWRQHSKHCPHMLLYRLQLAIHGSTYGSMEGQLQQKESMSRPADCSHACPTINWLQRWASWTGLSMRC